AGHGEQHAGLTLPEHELLQGATRRVDGDSSRAVLPTDSRPERVSASERNRLERRPRDRMRAPHQGRSERRVICFRVGNMAELSSTGRFIIRDWIQLLDLA